MEFIQTDNSKESSGHYSPGVRANGLLFISGQLSVDPATGKPAEGGVQAEARQALANVDAVLSASGLTKTDIVQCRVYLPDVAYWDELNKAYAEYFGSHKPARVVVPSNHLYGGCKVEIEAIAAY